MGSDVQVAVTTEHAALGIEIASGDAVVAGKVGNLLADGDLIKSREWPNDNDLDETIDNFDSIAIDVSDLTGTSASSITTSSDGSSAAFTLTMSSNPVAGDTVDITNPAGTTITLTAHATNQSGTTFARSGPASGVIDAMQTAFETVSNNGFTLTQPTTESLKFTTSQGADLGIVLSGDEKNVVPDVVGMEVSTSTTDEDVAYFGQRTALKSEIRKETSVTITRKRTSGDWSVLFNKARGGLTTFTSSAQTDQSVDDVTGASDTAGVTANLTAINNHTYQPDRNYGFRVYLQFKNGSEVMSIRNCCFSEYSASVNPDGIQEETITFVSYVDPVVASAGTTAVIAASDF